MQQLIYLITLGLAAYMAYTGHRHYKTDSITDGAFWGISGMGLLALALVTGPG